MTAMMKIAVFRKSSLPDFAPAPCGTAYGVFIFGRSNDSRHCGKALGQPLAEEYGGTALGRAVP